MPRKTFSVLRSLKNKNKILKIIKEATAIIIDQIQIPANKLLNLHKISLSIITISPRIIFSFNILGEEANSY